MKDNSLRKDEKILRVYSLTSFFYQILNRGLRSLNNPLYLPYVRYPAAELFWTILSVHVKQRKKG